jgi:hypothetical protein
MGKVEAKVEEADKEEEEKAGVEEISTLGHIPLTIGEIYRQKIKKGN